MSSCEDGRRGRVSSRLLVSCDGRATGSATLTFDTRLKDTGRDVLRRQMSHNAAPPLWFCEATDLILHLRRLVDEVYGPPPRAFCGSWGRWCVLTSVYKRRNRMIVRMAVIRTLFRGELSVYGSLHAVNLDPPLSWSWKKAKQKAEVPLLFRSTAHRLRCWPARCRGLLVHVDGPTIMR